jgi:hypothetical protein
VSRSVVLGHYSELLTRELLTQACPCEFDLNQWIWIYKTRQEGDSSVHMFMNEYSVIEKGKVNANPATLIAQAAVLEARINRFLSGARALWVLLVVSSKAYLEGLSNRRPMRVLFPFAGCTKRIIKLQQRAYSQPVEHKVKR